MCYLTWSKFYKNCKYHINFSTENYDLEELIKTKFFERKQIYYKVQQRLKSDQHNMSTAKANKVAEMTL